MCINSYIIFWSYKFKLIKIKIVRTIVFSFLFFFSSIEKKELNYQVFFSYMKVLQPNI